MIDPEGTKIALTAPFPNITIAGNVANQVSVTQEYLDDIYKVKNPYSSLMHKYYGTIFPLWDETAAAIMLDPTIVKNTTSFYLDVDTAPSSPNYGNIHAYQEALKPTAQNLQKVNMVVSIDGNRLKKSVQPSSEGVKILTGHSERDRPTALLLQVQATQHTGTSAIEIALTDRMIDDIGWAYYANISVGNPSQVQAVLIDSGSNELLFTAANATACKTRNGCAGGTFDVTKSSTFDVVTRGGLSIGFEDSSKKKGDYFTDEVQIEGSNKSEPYPTFLDALVQSGAIESRLYGIHLNQINSSGSIIFGGIDIAKFQGPMTTLDCLLDGRKTATEHKLKLNKITVNPHDENSEELLLSSGQVPHAVFLDSGNARCNTATLDLHLADLFAPKVAGNSGVAADHNGNPLCTLMVEPSGPGEILAIGDAVMRAGYWVFDLDNGQISVAQANIEASSSDIVKVLKGVDGLSRAVQRHFVGDRVSASGDYMLAIGHNPSFTSSLERRFDDAAATVEMSKASAPWPLIGGLVLFTIEMQSLKEQVNRVVAQAH
ncbi:acid protease [Aureobasidium pullulans]|uniref:Acid protease n=1 Tax=Aureobasidium pullulans TaxID=5580 RepID=A0A4V4ICK4_AURPU|nr:acid protease [Aureobasidium pullulans]